jgi:hypothetical protein
MMISIAAPVTPALWENSTAMDSNPADRQIVDEFVAQAQAVLAQLVL